jgi:DNA-binding response OmpR family regulator
MLSEEGSSLEVKMSRVIGGSILVVDDNLPLAENIAEILALAGYRTVVAGSAEEALPHTLCEELGMVITDFRLPGLDGLELVRRVRAAGAHVRCIVMSADPDDRVRARSEEMGARFMPKPLSPGALTSLVRVGNCC